MAAILVLLALTPLPDPGFQAPGNTIPTIPIPTGGGPTFDASFVRFHDGVDMMQRHLFYLSEICCIYGLVGYDSVGLVNPWYIGSECSAAIAVEGGRHGVQARVSFSWFPFEGVELTYALGLGRGFHPMFSFTP